LAIMPSLAGKPSGCRSGARPAGVCSRTCASLNGQRGTRGRQRIAGLSAARKPISARQYAACPEFSPDFLPFLPDFPLCCRIETLISAKRRGRGLSPEKSLSGLRRDLRGAPGNYHSFPQEPD
jgi:hypothetical protein